MSKKEILDEFEKKFEEIKKEIGFKSKLIEIDEIFYVKDFVLKEAYVSEDLSRQICSRIVDTYMSWNGYLQSLIIANPHNLINANESRMLNEDDKKEMMKMMSKIMALVSTNTYLGFIKDKKVECQFIDDSVELWNKSFKPFAEKILRKINDGWKEFAK